MWTWFAVLSAASIVMIVAMVRYTLALVDPARSRARRWRWGLVYAVAWLAIVASLSAIPDASSDTRPIAVLAAAGWIAFNAFWIWLWVAMARAQEQRGAAADLPADADVLARRALIVAGVGAIALSGALWTIGAPQQLLLVMTAPGHRVPTVALAVGAAGFVAFMTGGVRIAFDVGRPLTREEIEELDRSIKFGPQGRVARGVYRRSKVRLYGPVKGVSGAETFTFREIANACHSGLWRRDAKWLSVFLMLGGAAAMAIGGIGAALALGSATTRLVIGGLVAYAAVQTAIGIARGRLGHRH